MKIQKFLLLAFSLFFFEALADCSYNLKSDNSQLAEIDGVDIDEAQLLVAKEALLRELKHKGYSKAVSYHSSDYSISMYFPFIGGYFGLSLFGDPVEILIKIKNNETGKNTRITKFKKGLFAFKRSLYSALEEIPACKH